MSEIQRASPGARRKFFLLAAAMFVALLFSDPVFERIGDWLAEDPEKRFDIFIAGLTILFSPLLFIGIHFWRMGSSSVEYQRFPPPDTEVIVDTPITLGRQAVLRGRSMQIGAVLLWIIAIGTPLALWFIIRVLTNET